MEKPEQEQDYLPLLTDGVLLNQPIMFDNNVAHSVLQSTKLTYLDSDDINVYILWLTNNNQTEVELLNGINIRKYHTNDNLIDFISELKISNVFLIIDYELVGNILSLLDDFTQIIFIYILAKKEDENMVIVTDSARPIRKVSNNKSELFRFIIEDIDTCTHDSISSNIFDLTTAKETTNQTKNTSFLWYYLLVESLFDLNAYNKNAKSDLIEYCRQQYPHDNIVQQNCITEFETQYVPENAIQWYTKDSFIYRQLNKALQNRDIDAIFKFRFFLIDLQQKLEEHYDEDIIRTMSTAYRGQEMSPLELTKLKNSIGKYISFNTYLSTSVDKNVALDFASGSSSVVLQIKMDENAYLENKRLRPISIQDKSVNPDECEVIFPIGATFLLESMEQLDGKLTIIFKLTDVNNSNKMVDFIQTTYLKNIPAKLKFAELTVSLGDYKKSELYIKMLIEDLESSSDMVNIGYAYNLMGEILLAQQNYQSALSYFEKALYSCESDNKHRASILINLGKLHTEKYEYKIALECLTEALKYRHQMEPHELASLHNMFGITYLQMENIDDALKYVKESLDIDRSKVTTTDTNWFSYYLLALINLREFNYPECLKNIEFAFEIALEILPKSHPSFIHLYTTMGFVRSRSQDSLLAMKYFQKALEIIQANQQTQYLNAVTHISIYNEIFQLYASSMNVINMLYCTQAAVKVYNQFENYIDKTVPTLRAMYVHLGLVKRLLGNYTSSLHCFNEAIVLSKTIDDQMSLRCEIGAIYLKQGKIEKALKYFNELLQLNYNTSQLTVDNHIVYSIYHYMSDLYKLRNDLTESIIYAKKALQLQISKINKDFNCVAKCYIHLFHLCQNQGEIYIKEILNIIERYDLSVMMKCNCHYIVGYYYTLQKDFSSALSHYEKSLSCQLMHFPPCYQQLISTYSRIGHIYQEEIAEDLDKALFYYEKSRDLYLALSKIETLPTSDMHRTLVNEGCLVKNLHKSSSLTDTVLHVYCSIATNYAKKGNREQALKHLQLIEEILHQYQSEKHPISLRCIYFLIASNYQKILYYDRAIFNYEKHLAYIPHDNNEYAYTFFLIATLYYRKKEYSMTISKCEIALTLLHNSQTIDHQKMSLCYYYTTISYDKLKDYEHCFIFSKKAIEQFLLCIPIKYDSIIELYVIGTAALHSARPWKSNESLNYIITALKFCEYCLTNDSLRALYFSVGEQYLFHGKFHAAFSYFNKALIYATESHEIIDIYRQQWMCLLFSGQIDKAHHIMISKINYQLNQTNINFIDISDSYIDMGLVCYHLGNYTLALLCYQSAFYILQKYQDDKSHENYRRIYIGIAYIYLEYGQVKCALLFCLKARSIHFKNAASQSSFISIYIILGLIECKLDNYYKALEYFGRAWECIFNEKQHYPQLHRVLYNHIGYVYYRLGQTEIAMKNYLKSLSLYSDCRHHPHLAQVYKNIGLVYEHEERNHPMALANYKHALEVLSNKKHPHHILYTSMIIRLQNKMNLWEKIKSTVLSLLRVIP